MHSSKLILALIASATIANKAYAHAPNLNFPAHHAGLLFSRILRPRVNPSFHGHTLFRPQHFASSGPNFGTSLSGLLSKGGIGNVHSGFFFNFKTGSQYANFVRTAFSAGAAGSGPTSAFAGGTVTGGMIQGDLYVLNRAGTPGQYFNLGEFTGTVGTNVPASFNTQFQSLLGSNSLTPNFQNRLSFASGPGQGGSGNQFAGFGRFSGTWRHSFMAGEHLGGTSTGGSVTGGAFVGTAYRNALTNPNYISTSFAASGDASNSPLYYFAVGNNPFNNPAGRNTIATISSQTSYVLFGNGVNKTVTNGQLLYPMINGGQNGSVLTMAESSFNSGNLNQTITNLSSFLLF